MLLRGTGMCLPRTPSIRPAPNSDAPQFTTRFSSPAPLLSGREVLGFVSARFPLPEDRVQFSGKDFDNLFELAGEAQLLKKILDVVRGFQL